MKFKLLILLYWSLIAFGLYSYGITWPIATSIFLSMFFGVAFHHYVIHEHFAHKKYIDNIKNKILSVMMLLFPLGSPMEYSLIHRQHHKFVDTKRDPHSPEHMGFWKVFFLEINSNDLDLLLVKDFLKSKFQKNLNKYYFPLLLLLVLLAFAINPTVVYFVMAPIGAYTALSAQIISSFGHEDGIIRNLKWLRVFNPFEWGHSEHHQYYNNQFIK